MIAHRMLCPLRRKRKNKRTKLHRHDGNLCRDDIQMRIVLFPSGLSCVVCAMRCFDIHKCQLCQRSESTRQAFHYKRKCRFIGNSGDLVGMGNRSNHSNIQWVEHKEARDAKTCPSWLSLHTLSVTHTHAHTHTHTFIHTCTHVKIYIYIYTHIQFSEKNITL